MNTKKILHILTLVAIVCSILILNAMASDPQDAKIIRFDGTGNVEYSVSYEWSDGYLTTEVTNGVLRITGAYSDRYAWVKVKNTFSLDDYPYMSIKLKTNDSEAFTYASTNNAKAQLFCKTAGGQKGKSFNFKTYNFEGTEQEFIMYVGTQPATQEAPNGTIENTNKSFEALRITPFREDGNTTQYSDAVTEIEYIAFFKTLDEALEYGMPKKIVMEGKSSKAHSLYIEDKATSSVTSDGSIRIGGMAGSEGTHQPSFIPKAPFSEYILTDYPYIKLKLKTNWPKKIQLYFQTNSSDEYGTYISKRLDNVPIELNADQVFEFSIYDMNNSDSADFDVPVTLGDGYPFMQFKEASSEDTTEYYAEIAYLAFFREKADMEAFGTDETEALVDAADALDGTEYTYKLHSENSITDLADTLKAYIEKNYENVSATVTVTAEEGDTEAVATVVLDNIYADSEKTVTINVNITEIAESTFDFENVGAQIRIDAITDDSISNQAMRFLHKLTYSAEGCDSVVFGAVMGNTAEPVLGGTNTVSYTAMNKKINQDGSVEYNTVITNIPTTQLDTEITVRPYATYTINGESFTVYGESITRSVNGILAEATGA